jgi:hypothetical protein
MSTMPHLQVFWWNVVLPLVCVFIWWGWTRARGTEHNAMLSPAEVVIAAATLGPFVTAFAAKLGERFGERVALQRLPRWRRWRQRHELIVTVRSRNVIVIELDSQMGDDARLALIDLDVKRPELWGKRLRWDETTKAWCPTPDDSGTRTPDGL